MAKKNDVYKNLKDAINKGTTVGFKYGVGSKSQATESYVNLYRSFLSVGSLAGDGELTHSQAKELYDNIQSKKKNLDELASKSEDKDVRKKYREWKNSFNPAKSDTARKVNTNVHTAPMNISDGGSSRGVGGTSTSGT